MGEFISVAFKNKRRRQFSNEKFVGMRLREVVWNFDNEGMVKFVRIRKQSQNQYMLVNCLTENIMFLSPMLKIMDFVELFAEVGLDRVEVDNLDGKLFAISYVYVK